ncbi:MAG: hypothetical protein ACFCU2_05935 [Acidimicrobiia bacterium]
MTSLYQDRARALFMGIAAGERREDDKEWEMLYMSNAKASRRARRWAYANRPYESIDNPVKRYLGSKSLAGKRSRTTDFRRVFGRTAMRPAF